MYYESGRTPPAVSILPTGIVEAGILEIHLREPQVCLSGQWRSDINSQLIARPNIGAKEDLGSGFLDANARNFPQEKMDSAVQRNRIMTPQSPRRVPYDDDGEEPCLKVQAEHVNTVCSGGSPYPIRRLSARATVWGTTSFKGAMVAGGALPG